MFQSLTQGFKDATLKLKGQTRVSEENIAPALEIVKRSLLDADVDFKVVNDFLKSTQEKLLGNVVQTKSKQSGMKVSAADHFIQVCEQEITDLLGSVGVKINKNPKGPTVILLVGLQGAGKTTHAAKIAKLMKEKHGMRPLLVAADVYRPAAKEQLRVLSEKISVPFFTLELNNAVEIAKQGVELARAEWNDLVIIDTAGRLALDDTLMTELENIKSVVYSDNNGNSTPQNTILVIDSMIGQDAVRTASAFDARLNLTGVLLTKLDGDTRGGAALSVRRVTGKPILFIGTGEQLEKIEEFRPEGLASRILGLGDIVGLMDDFTRVVDEEQAAKTAEKAFKGNFSFEDFLEMTTSMQKMGGIKDLVSKMPMMGNLPQGEVDKLSDKSIVQVKSIVLSMTKQERNSPELLMGKTPGGRSRVNRIAKGSGNSEKAVKDLVERFMQMRTMMNMMGGMGGLFGGSDSFLNKIPGVSQLNKIAGMAKMMKQGMGGVSGGAASMFGDGMMDGFGMPQGGSNVSSADLAELNRIKKRKKEEKLRKSKR
jgi:signal recognition particle subunit SRP54